MSSRKRLFSQSNNDQDYIPQTSNRPIRKSAREQKYTHDLSPSPCSSLNDLDPVDDPYLPDTSHQITQSKPYPSKPKPKKPKSKTSHPGLSREARRKANHSIIEKRRREKMNKAFEDLRGMIPGLNSVDCGDERGDSGGKGEFKLEVLEKTITHVRALESELSSLKSKSSAIPIPIPIPARIPSSQTHRIHSRSVSSKLMSTKTQSNGTLPLESSFPTVSLLTRAKRIHQRLGQRLTESSSSSEDTIEEETLPIPSSYVLNRNSSGVSRSEPFSNPGRHNLTTLQTQSPPLFHFSPTHTNPTSTPTIDEIDQQDHEAASLLLAFSSPESIVPVEWKSPDAEEDDIRMMEREEDGWALDQCYPLAVTHGEFGMVEDKVEKGTTKLDNVAKNARQFLMI